MDYQKIIDIYAPLDTFSYKLGMRLTRIERGYGEGELQTTDFHGNADGTVHGGCLLTLMDTVAGYAAATEGKVTVTSAAHNLFLRPAYVGDLLKCVARVIKAGRTLVIFDVEVLRQQEELVCKGEFTFFKTDEDVILEGTAP